MILLGLAAGGLAGLPVTHAIGPPEKLDQITAPGFAVPAEKDLLALICIGPAPKTILAILANQAGPGPLAAAGRGHLFQNNTSGLNRIKNIQSSNPPGYLLDGFNNVISDIGR